VPATKKPWPSLPPDFRDLLPLPVTPDSVRGATRDATREFWATRERSRAKNAAKGANADRGTRGEATSGKAMDGFARIAVRALIGAGVPPDTIYAGSPTAVPGYYRAEKRWDVVVVRDGKLRVAIELKSQVGSFGNNANNRLEEGLGNITDARKAEEVRNLGGGSPAWFGFLILLEDHEESNSPVRVIESHFPVDTEFRNASYATRYALWCQRVQTAGLHSATAFLTSPRGSDGSFNEPLHGLSLTRFLIELQRFVRAHP
jgi:hypothetical protein